MKSFTDIGQFRSVIRALKSSHDYQGQDEDDQPIFRHVNPYPTLKFIGTVKLHGTNAAIVKYKDGHYEFQSRERVLALGDDNSAFMLNLSKKNYQQLFDGIEFDDHCAIYGEWCGQGIQAGVAISKLPKMFVIFAVRIDNVYQDLGKYLHIHNNEENIYNIRQFEHYHLDIDFNNPEDVNNTLVDFTTAVEAQCPVGKHFGVEGVGEGIVWEYTDDTKRYIFKVKGEKHQSSKIKKLVSVDVEQIKGLKEFASYAVTESRLNQGVDKLKELNKPIDMTSTGEFLRWIVTDIIKEEQDTIVENQIDPKKVNGFISSVARQWWFSYLDKQEY